jgi:hypothetical protein
MLRNYITLLMLTALFSSSAIAANKLYKWADEAGNIHYSEKPPGGRAAEEIISDAVSEVKPAPLDTTPVEIPQPADPQAAQQLADKCQGLYHRLELYNSKQPITDREGNVMVVSEEMREAKITEFRAALDQFCR